MIDSRQGRDSRRERGASLLATLVIVLGLTVLAAAAINMATRGTIGAAHKAHADARTACANAAAARMLAEFALAGAPPAVNIQAAGIPGGPTLNASHYDNTVVVKQVNRLDSSVGGDIGRDMDVTNTIRAVRQGGAPLQLVATCVDAQGRQFEVELFVRLGLL